MKKILDNIQVRDLEEAQEMANKLKVGETATYILSNKTRYEGQGPKGRLFGPINYNPDNGKGPYDDILPP